jgi:outer membrane biosynthesis protein TonB
MSAATQPMDHLALDLVLPWHEEQEQQEKFKKLLKKVIVPIMVVMLVMPLLPDLSGEDEVEEKVVTKVMLEPPVLEPTPPPPSEPKKQKTQDKRPNAKPKPGANNGVPNMASLSQQLTKMRNSLSQNRQQNKNKFVTTSGDKAKSSRARLGKDSLNSSGGIKSSDITVNAKGAALAAHQSDTVSSSISDVVIPTAAEYAYDPSKSYRDKHSIRREIERYRGGAIYPIYTKALRLNPDMGGRFVFSFTILPSGKVTNVKLVASELSDPKLEKEILAKMKFIDFGKENKAPTPVEYTFSFVPS